MRQRQTLAVLLCVGTLICLLPLPYIEITSGHEAREGLRLRAMMTNGDWFGAHVLRKPPLYYWLSGLIAGTRGGVVDALTLRLPSGLLGIASAVLITLAGWRAATRNGAVWAGFLLLTAPLHVQQSYSSRTDMTFSFFVSASLLVFFAIVHQTLKQERQRTGLAYLLAFLLACAFLSKGPVAVVLVALPIAGFLVWRRDWRGFQLVLRMGPLVLLSVLTGGWCFLALWSGGEAFWRTQVMEENVVRFIGGIDRMSSLYYLGPLLGVFAPWSLLLPFALWRAVKERAREPGPFFLALWWLSIVFFFQLVAYKRARYLLPTLFPAALLVGWWISSHLHVTAMRIHGALWEKLLRIGLSLIVGLTIVAGVLLLYGTQGSGLLSRRLLEKAPGPAIAPYAEAYGAWLAAHFWLSALWLGLFSLCLGLALWLFWSRRYAPSLVSLLCGLVLVYVGLYPSWLTVAGKAASPHAYTQRLLDKLGGERAVAFINPYDEKSVPVLFALQEHLQLKDVPWPWGAPQPRLPSGYYLVTENRKKELSSNGVGTWTEVLHDTDTTRWPITLFFYSASSKRAGSSQQTSLYCRYNDGPSKGDNAMTALAATTSPLIRRYTLEEFWALDNPPGGGHYELIAGVLYMVPPPDGPHTTVVSRLIRRFSAYLDLHPELGELFVPRTAIWTSAHTYLEPDLMFVSADILQRTDPGRLTTASLVVEVISPSTAVYDRTTKADTYAALGVGELWLINTQQHTIEQRVLGAEQWEQTTIYAVDEIIHAVRLPGFRCEVRAVFA